MEQEQNLQPDIIKKQALNVYTGVQVFTLDCTVEEFIKMYDDDFETLSCKVVPANNIKADAKAHIIKSEITAWVEFEAMIQDLKKFRDDLAKQKVDLEKKEKKKK